MQLTQRKHINHHHQMCPPPIGSSATWFMNLPTTGLVQPPAPGPTYHNYNSHNHHHDQNSQQNHQTYYDVNVSSSQPQTLSSNSNIHNSLSTNPLGIPRNNNLAQSSHLQHHQQHSQTQVLHHHPQPQQQHHNHPHNHHHHQQQQQHQHQQHQLQAPLTHQHHRQQSQQHLAHPQANGSQYNYPYPSNPSPQVNLNQSHQSQQNNQSYNQIPIHHHQPLTIQQPPPQLQHVHQQPSPILSQVQSQLSPHTTASQPRPSPTLHQHPQPSPNYQQHSPHLTSPSLQPSPVLHHHQAQQPSPSTRLQQQTPPHHTSTPLSQHHISRPASVKELVHISNTSSFALNIPQSEIRMLEFNRRLQNRPAGYRVHPTSSLDYQDDLAWWHEFMTDFFRDDATLTLKLLVDDKPTTYILRRSLIPKFFKSYFTGGVTDMSFNLLNPKERRNGSSIVLDCDQTTIITRNILNHPKINMTKLMVCAEGHLTLDFVGSGSESLLIKSWILRLNMCREYVDRSLTAMGLPSTMFIEPVTTQGLPKSTISYLKICSILEPMQDIMAQHKQSNMDPKSCLKKFLYDKHRFISEDDNSKVIPIKRRKRKQDLVPAQKSTTTSKKTKAALAIVATVPTNNVSTQSYLEKHELPPISIVGEPLRMEEYQDENERLISKIENSNHQPDPTNPIIKSETSQTDEVDYFVNPVEESDKPVEKSDSSVSCSLEESETLAVIKTVTEIEKSSTCKTDLLNQTKDAVESSNEESSSRPVSEEPSEKENNGSVLNEETSVASQGENHFNIMNRMLEDGEDVCKPSDLAVSKPSQTISGTKISVQSNSKQSRRRSNEKREKFCEGLMRTSDFVVAIKDLKLEHPPLWKITSGNNLLQEFESKSINGVFLYESTDKYAGWNPEIKRDYVGVDVKILSRNRTKEIAERLQLNFEKLDDSENFHNKHFVVYLQILISTALDPKFWESIETASEHHDYFLTSRKIIDEIIKRHKVKLSSKLKLGEAMMKNFEKYPNLMIKPIDESKQAQICRACNTNSSTQMVSFGNRSYDLHSYKPVKVTSEPSKTDDIDDQSLICDSCLIIVKLYSEVHHMGWKFFNKTLEKVDQLRGIGKSPNAILDECLNDEDWINKNYADRDSLWSKINEVL